MTENTAGSAPRKDREDARATAKRVIESQTSAPPDENSTWYSNDLLLGELAAAIVVLTEPRLSQPSRHARTREEAVLIAGGPVDWPTDPPGTPDLAHVRERMPERTDRSDYLVHALRFFEDVLAYAERLEEGRDDA